eukprot:TRINITY_DN8714_c0_g1_i4.p1 TRINITY_DN8714_c0_g1~~TRINITY_DN8714_c0_g1_i4.p1  ORF type:complete len:113 (+),score=5.02 TRINITY_DN8714_c0_g1_i4:105-443(+)
MDPFSLCRWHQPTEQLDGRRTQVDTRPSSVMRLQDDRMPTITKMPLMHEPHVSHDSATAATHSTAPIVLGKQILILDSQLIRLICQLDHQLLFLHQQLHMVIQTGMYVLHLI